MFRYVDYTGEDQTLPTHPDYKEIAEPTDRELITLQNMVKIFKVNGGELDPGKVEWTSVRDTHPHFDNKSPLVSLSC